MASKQDGMNFVHCPKQGIYLRNFFAKQGQGFKPLATLLYPNIGRVTSPPRPGIELELIIYCLLLMHSSGTTGTPNSRVRIVVALQKYYKGLYRDLSDRYLGVKNSNSSAPRAARSPITKKMW